MPRTQQRKIRAIRDNPEMMSRIGPINASIRAQGFNPTTGRKLRPKITTATKPRHLTPAEIKRIQQAFMRKK